MCLCECFFFQFSCCCSVQSVIRFDELCDAHISKLPLWNWEFIDDFLFTFYIVWWLWCIRINAINACHKYYGHYSQNANHIKMRTFDETLIAATGFFMCVCAKKWLLLVQKHGRCIFYMLSSHFYHISIESGYLEMMCIQVNDLSSTKKIIKVFINIFDSHDKHHSITTIIL